MKVLVLGHKGMLGHMVTMYMRSKDFDVITSQKRWPTSQSEILNFDGDYIINCIGSIPQRTDSFNLNWQLPIWLDLHAPCKVIHPGTDCEMDSDAYGISKNVAGNYIRSLSKQTKSIKTSIIGPELNTQASLMEWFLSQENEITGWSEHFWNGNTTLEWSKHCYDMMLNWDKYNSQTIIGSKCISKFDLLHKIKKAFDKDISIKEDGTYKAHKCLTIDIETPTADIQLQELKDFYYGN